MIKKITTALVLFSIASPLLALAGPFNPQGEFSPITTVNVFEILKTLFFYLFDILLAVSVFFFLYAAWLYLQSGGGEDTTKARNYLIYGAIGIAIALFSYAIPGIVDSILNNR